VESRKPARLQKAKNGLDTTARKGGDTERTTKKKKIAEADEQGFARDPAGPAYPEKHELSGSAFGEIEGQKELPPTWKCRDGTLVNALHRSDRLTSAHHPETGILTKEKQRRGLRSGSIQTQKQGPSLGKWLKNEKRLVENQ